ncbi:hypothetical protein ACLB2K_011257 [Fragaria x ananassa]
MASRLASRAASYLRIQVTYRGFASVVKDLNYANSHEWVKGEGFGAVESVKETSDVYSPMSGKVVEVNEELNSSPGLVNSSPYEKGWIIKVEINDSGELKNLMDFYKYTKFCEEEDAHRLMPAIAAGTFATLVHYS